jgi:hypothetical protein
MLLNVLLLLKKKESYFKHKKLMEINGLISQNCSMEEQIMW